MDRYQKLLEQRIAALESVVGTSNEPRSVFSSNSTKQGLSASLGHIPCKCGAKIQVYDPVYVTGQTEGTDHGTAFKYNGSLEIEFPRGVLGVAQQSGHTGQVITVAFSGAVLIRKAPTVLKAGDVVWLNENGYVENQPTGVEELTTTHSAGVTHFQVLQDATETDNVVYVRFLTDLSSRGVPVKVVADPEDEEAVTTNLCDVYPFGPEVETVIHKRIEIRDISDLGKVFEVDSWHFATIIGGKAFIKEGGNAEINYYQITDTTYTNTNDINIQSWVYKGIPVDSFDSPIPPTISEDDKVDIYVHEGYPWNLQVGDNVQQIGTVGAAIAVNNTLNPQPVVKIEGGAVKVFDKETGGVALKTLGLGDGGYRIASSPTITLSVYNETFPLAIWSKRDNFVRVYVPVI